MISSVSSALEFILECAADFLTLQPINSLLALVIAFFVVKLAKSIFSLRA